MMIRYEMKKICMGTAGRITLFLILTVLIATTYFAINMSYVTTDGTTAQSVNGIKTGQELKKLSVPWSGILDETKIAEVLTENRRIEEEYGELSEEGIIDIDVPYAMKQGFEDIRELLNHAYGAGLRSYDYYVTDQVAPERASEFYPNRVRLLREWLEQEGEGTFSEAEKEYMISQFENTKTPFFYERFLAWSQLSVYFPIFMMLVTLIMGYSCSRLFAGEFSWKADAIFYTTTYGRSKAVAAKISTGILFVTIVYFIGALFMTAAALIIYGPGGWNCPIQVASRGWRSLYNITLGQEYIFMILGGYVGCLAINLLVMFTSAKTNSTVVASIIPFIILFLPSFVPNNKYRIVDAIMDLWPDQLLNLDMTFSVYKLYSVGGKIVPSVPVLLTIYTMLALVLSVIVYFVFRKKQAG